MSFLSFLFSRLSQRMREERADIQVPCKVAIYPPEEEGTDHSGKFIEATVVNVSAKGMAIITHPPFTEDYAETMVQGKYRIYVETVSPETGATQKLKGEIRRVKNVIDVDQPFSEIGVLLRSVEDNSKTELLDSLFESSEVAEEEEKKE